MVVQSSEFNRGLCPVWLRFRLIWPQGRWLIISGGSIKKCQYCSGQATWTVDVHDLMSITIDQPLQPETDETLSIIYSKLPRNGSAACTSEWSESWNCSQHLNSILLTILQSKGWMTKAQYNNKIITEKKNIIQWKHLLVHFNISYCQWIYGRHTKNGVRQIKVI